MTPVQRRQFRSELKDLARGLAFLSPWLIGFFVFMTRTQSWAGRVTSLPLSVYRTETLITERPPRKKHPVASGPSLPARPPMPPNS